MGLECWYTETYVIFEITCIENFRIVTNDFIGDLGERVIVSLKEN